MKERFPECMHTEKALARVREIHSPSDSCGAVGELLGHLSLDDQQRLLETEPLSARLEAVVRRLGAFLRNVGGDVERKRRLFN